MLVWSFCRRNTTAGPPPWYTAPRPADREVIEKFDIENGEGKIAAEAAVDARPEPEILKQLGRFEVGAEEPLFRVNRHAALEADTLRFGAAVYQKKDSEHQQSSQESVC